MRRIFTALLTGLMIAACTGQPSQSGLSNGETHEALRLGYFPNITHASALVGVESGILAKALGSSVSLEVQTFPAGSAAVEALLNGAIDATYVGPNPAINAYSRSEGQAIRIIAGATSGGASLVVRQGIATAVDLRGKRIASPQLGNTQDVALRTWLLKNGLTADAQGGGDVSILPQDNAQTLDTFMSGDIDGAWVPEPWGTRLVLEGQGHVLVDEATLWLEGRYVTTHLVVSTDYLNDHADVIRGLLAGHLEATEFVNENTAEAQRLTNQGIESITEKKIGEDVMSAAWKNLTFTVDPIASSLHTYAEDAARVGLLEPFDLVGIYDLTLLNELLEASGKPRVKGL